jgi:hypothetical protein
MWYQVMTALDEDSEAQINGTVVIAYIHGLTADHTELFSNGVSELTKLPYRRVALHFCYDSPTLRPVMLLIQSLLDRKARLHFRHHYGKQSLSSTPTKVAFK